MFQCRVRGRRKNLARAKRRVAYNSLLIFFTFIPPILCVTVSGCSFADSLSAYFNTYYNAQRLFAEAETEVERSLAVKQRENPLLAQYAIPGGTKQKLTSVIEKCSKLLQYHPESNLVDDALLMIGKSYYYQGEYQKAERKFRELLDGFPESDLAFESRLVLSKTYYRMGDKEGASREAKELVTRAEAKEEREYAAAASLVLAQIEVDRENILQAATHYRVSAEYGSTSEMRAAAYRDLGEMLSRLGEYESAADAFRKSYDESDNYASEFRARIGLARMLARLKRFDASLDVLDDLRANTNNREFFAEIDFEIAHVLRDSGDIAAAVDQYRYVDTSYARTEISAKSYFELGRLYEIRLGQYDSARAAYTKGRTEFPTSPVTRDLVTRSEYFNRYFVYLDEIARYDSMRSAMRVPEDSTSAFPHGDSLDVKDTGLSESSAPDSTLLRQAPAVVMPLDTLNARLARNKIELGGLFLSGIGVTDSAESWYQLVITEHPESKFVPRALFFLAQIYGQDSSVSSFRSDSLYREIIRRFPDSEFAAESRRILGLASEVRSSDVAESAYRVAEGLLRKGQNVAAIDSFRAVVRRYPESRFASKAQYAIGWIYEQVKLQPDSAVSSYRKLLTSYPSSEYAVRVKPKVDLVDAQKQKLLAPRDSSATQDSILADPGKTTDPSGNVTGQQQARQPLPENVPQASKSPKERPEEFPEP
jgi:TolA-binding protein